MVFFLRSFGTRTGARARYDWPKERFRASAVGAGHVITLDSPGYPWMEGGLGRFDGGFGLRTFNWAGGPFFAGKLAFWCGF